MELMSLSYLTGQFCSFKNASNQEEKKSARNLFLRDCGTYFEDTQEGYLRNYSHLLGDADLQEAKATIAGSKKFKGHAAQMRMQQLAKEYLAAWKGLKESFDAQEEAVNLGNKIDALVTAHRSFIIPRQDTLIGVRKNYSQSCELFYGGVVSLLAFHPEWFNALRSELELRSESVMLAIPHVCMMMILSNNLVDQGIVPEFFGNEEIEKLQQSYNELNDLDKASLGSADIWFGEGLSLLSESGKKVFHRIGEIINYSRGKENVQWNLVLQNVIQDLENDLQIAWILKDHSAVTNTAEMVVYDPETNPDEEVKKLLQSLTEEEYAKSREVFRSLPREKDTLESDSIDGLEDRSRLVAILTLAQSLHRKN